MMKLMRSALVLTPLLLITSGERVRSQSMTVPQLQAALQQAVCLNDWNRALQVITPLIGSSQLPETYRNELIRYRQQLQQLQSTNAQFANISNCEGVTAQTPTAQPSSSGSSRIDWERAAQTIGRSSQTQPRAETTAPSTQTALVFSDIRFGTVALEGRVTNRSRQSIPFSVVGYQILHNSGSRLTAVVSSNAASTGDYMIAPGETVSFRDRFTSEQSQALRRYFLNSLFIDLNHDGATYRMQLTNDPRLNTQSDIGL